MKVQDIIDKILLDICNGPKFEKTCDVITVGSPDNIVTGIVTTFMPTFHVIQETVRLGANFIISHEPTWFTGRDTTDWCQQDSVYLAKRRYLDEHNITIWRFHDHMHIGSDTDYIYDGLLKELGWHKYLQPDEKEPWIYELPETTVGELAKFFKNKLEMETIQIIGSPEMHVKRVGILVGGGSLGLGTEEMPMKVMERNRLDLLIVGDITEWTVCAYINDAYQMGFNRAMLTLGHERSEEAGMKHLAPWLAEHIPAIPVTFVDAKEPFRYL
ncbi:MAG: Nif3-like dinuclear metal center hexameric protein [Lachnospiraceae bacterium]|nr:Nif3-like dinuclear metal center hexameric protein [Lachnospiraceae bacterium]